MFHGKCASMTCTFTSNIVYAVRRQCTTQLCTHCVHNYNLANYIRTAYINVLLRIVRRLLG